MDFLYGGAFREGLPDAYERLILDAMLGDATLFTRSDEIEEQWALVDAIVGFWQRDRPAFPNYAAGTWGPSVLGRAHAPRRPVMAQALTGITEDRWTGDDTTIAEIERELARLRERRVAGRRAAEPAHVGDDAHRVGAAGVAATRPRRRSPGMAERHPSRTLLLVPRPDDGGRDRRGACRSGASRSATVRSAAR